MGFPNGRKVVELVVFFDEDTLMMNDGTDHGLSDRGEAVVVILAI